MEKKKTQFNRTMTAWLTHSLQRHFETVPTSKKQQTTEMWLLKYFKIQLA
jgi:hypothetical protein